MKELTKEQIKALNQILLKVNKLNDLQLLELSGIILEIINGRGNFRVNDLVISVIDIMNERKDKK